MADHPGDTRADWRRLLPLALCCLLAGRAAPGQETEPAEPPLGRGSSLGRIEPAPRPSIEIAPGTALRVAPHPRSPALTLIDIAVELEVIEHRGGWGKVRFGDWSGWVPLAPGGPGDPGSAPPRPPAPAGSPPASSISGPDPARLARAREILDAGGEPARLGPFVLYTDVEAGDRLDRFRAIASSLVAAYGVRYGLTPGFTTPLAVILFRHETEYRAYEGAETDLADLGAMGHAGNGIAALFVGGRRTSAVEPLLIHELTHLINRATLGIGSPPWLEEGLANDLAFSRVTPAGRLELGTLSGSSYVSEEVTQGPDGRHRVQQTLHTDGPIASASLLVRRAAARDLAPLELLTDLSWGEFAQPRGRDTRYVHSAFFVRFLLDGGDPDLRRGLRAFLASVAAGGAADAASLLAAIDSDWGTLEADFRRWLGRFAAGR